MVRNTGAADDLELVDWLCERIWVLQGNFTHEDGYAAARVSIAEMLRSGTTCFLESMVLITFSFPSHGLHFCSHPFFCCCVPFPFLYYHFHNSGMRIPLPSTAILTQVTVGRPLRLCRSLRRRSRKWHPRQPWQNRDGYWHLRPRS